MSEDRDLANATKIVDFEEVAFFRIPNHWVVEKEEGSGLAVYDDRPGSGTLRIWAEEFTFEDAAQRNSAIAVVHEGGMPATLGENATLSHSVHTGEENGELLRAHQWIVAVRSAPKGLRIVTFTYTIEEVNAGGEGAAWEIQVVDMAVRGAHYPIDTSQATA